MARNRVIYQSEAIFVNKNAGELDGYDQLERVQSANYSFSINRQDINQYGQLGKLDSIILDAPTVTADLSYYVTDGFTERALGFLVATGDILSTGGGFVSGMLADGSGANIMVLTTPEGTDADLPDRTSTGAANSAIGIGNAYLSNYSVDMSVGSIPTASVSFDALNITSDAVGSTYATPAIDPVNGTAEAGDCVLPNASTGQGNVAALRPGNITVDVSNFDSEDTLINIGTNVDGAHVQSASLSVPMSRSTLERLGSRSAFARTVDFPIVASLSVSAIVNEVEAANLADIIDDESEKTVTLTLKTDDGLTGALYTLKGCSLDSESISSSIGSNKTVDITFSTSVGGPNDTTHGVFMSGASSTKLNGGFS
jgi:hypothetical protein